MVVPGKVHQRAAWVLHLQALLLSAAGAAQVVVSGEVLRPWLAEGGVAPGACACAPDAAYGGLLKLFSLNDYLGLSTHPAVCQAAADAALLFGSGARASPVSQRLLCCRAHVFC